MDALERDGRIRWAAIAWLEQQAQLRPDGLLGRHLLANGFVYNPELEIGEPPATYGPSASATSRIHLVGPRGIFKPKQCDYPLTITTTHQGPYNDHFDESTGLLMYHYTTREAAGEALNEGLRALMALKRPVIYLHALAPGRYMHTPAWVLGDYPEKENGVFGIALDDEMHRYATDFDPASISVEERQRTYWQRLRRPAFRQEVLVAYKHRCALCRLGHTALLDAAHIKPHSESGPATVPNGIAMCRLHHGAYDANLLGIDPNRRIVIPRSVLDERDGPTLKHSIQGLHRQDLWVPSSPADHPNRDWLKLRWQRFNEANNL